MPLTDAKVRAAKPLAKDYKLADDKGLFLLVASTGHRRWRYKYRANGKRQIKSPVNATGLFHFTGRIAGHPEQPRVAFAGAHSWVHTHSRAFSEPWPMLDCPTVLSPCRQTPPADDGCASSALPIP
jgi:hypothetical protein